MRLPPFADNSATASIAFEAVLYLAIRSWQVTGPICGVRLNQILLMRS